MGAFGGFAAHYRNQLLHKETQELDTHADEGARQELGGLHGLPQGKWSRELQLAGNVGWVQN